jgi:hypothetical protein
MKVTGIGTTTGAGQARRSAKTDKPSSSNFADHLSEPVESADETFAVESPPMVGGIDALLAVQASGDALEQENRRRMIKRGDDLLDMLEEIRHGLLMGSIPKDSLVTLAQMVRSRRDTVTDPRLAGVLDEIELRAEVELAKLSRRIS